MIESKDACMYVCMYVGMYVCRSCEIDRLFFPIVLINVHIYFYPR